MSIEKFRADLSACTTLEEVADLYDGLSQAEKDDVGEAGWDPVCLDGSDEPQGEADDGLLAWTATHVVRANVSQEEPFAEISERTEKFRADLAACATLEEVADLFNGLTYAERDQVWENGWDPVCLDGTEEPDGWGWETEGLLAWTATHVVRADGYTTESYAAIDERDHREVTE